jgi:hypothetical protein
LGTSFELLGVFNRSDAKPRFAPSPGYDGVTQVAEGNEILWRVVAALRSRHNVVGVQLTVGIASSVAADLALETVALLDTVCESFPSPRFVESLSLHGRIPLNRIN